MVRNTSLCGLGQTAPNPVLSTLRFFRKEYTDLLDRGYLRPEAATATGQRRRRSAAAATVNLNYRASMAAKTLTIDGKQISADESATVLEAATEAGIKIPTLCHLDGVYDVGACRLCLVEVAGIAKLLPACTTKVAEGMEVKTDSERLRKYRRMTLELLFAERNHVCAVCVANGHCELQTLAYSQGMDHVRYDYPSRNGTWTPPTRCSAWTTTAASSAPAASGSAGTSKAPAPRTSPAAAPSPRSSPISTSPGATPTPAPVRQVRAWPAPPARCSTKGPPSSEMERDRTKLEFIVTAREKKQWIA